MRQVIQSFKTGELIVEDVPSPVLRSRGVLVRTAASLVSAGTERMIIDFAGKDLIGKARARPDLVRQVVDKARREGVLNTLDSVRNRLDQPLPLGYSSAGTVVGVGADVESFQVGDRVACAGAGYASHAEEVFVPRNLVVKLADAVAFEAGAFVTVGAIALQGIRQADVMLGHKVAVIGLGLLGQLTVQMLKAAGCQVVGIDLDPARVELARTLGADAVGATSDALGLCRMLTGGRGVDSVLITADTKENGPIELAGELSRDRGVVVAVGAVGLNVPRKPFFEKEIDLRLSRSYGPGRYDPQYEEEGRDYPYGYVRWTEQRNMEAFAEMLASGAVRIAPLVTHRFPISDALRAYDVITRKINEPFLGVVLEYDQERELPTRIEIPLPSDSSARSKREAEERREPAPVRLGVLGAGLFANATLLPAIRKVAGIEPIAIASGAGLSARKAGGRFGFRYCASNESSLLEDEQINWLAILTRHDLHAKQVIAGMKAGKDVFVEKPLALNRDELISVMEVWQETKRRLMVGFNRRFAPMVQEMHRFLTDRRRPLMINCRVNAGFIPANHWTQDPAIGGGRIIGEGCHWIDLLQFLIGSPPVEVYARALKAGSTPVADEVVITLSYEDGSVGTIHYTAGGHRAFSKERFEAFGDEKVAVLDDYRSLQLQSGRKRVHRRARLRTDKGHQGEWEAIEKAAQSGSPSPITATDLVATHLAAYAAVESLRSQQPVPLKIAEFWGELAKTENAEMTESA